MNLPAPLRVCVIAFAAASASLCAQAAVESVKVSAVAHFDFNGTAIRPDEKAAILAEVGAMKNVTWQSVTATGYTDSVGARPYNERLSARRAKAVKTYLVDKGLEASMIEAVGKGPSDPVADNGSDDGRARNRRTLIEFKGIRTTTP